ncbi:aldehyde reductase II [Fusarium pseudoanthophilum]|uniref:Aldehyde reductase II n=1 Tax=Fusarium pseudoanthophilum TaxID=48495 RepID=A0A8H5L5C3_9HYPO|nr:aldehyde reductase II [Fusarium pseudoanthophilum]
MTRVLLTGRSGSIALHVLRTLLDRGRSVVATVRSQAKADHIKSTYFDVPSSRLDFAIVEDISVKNAYDEVMKSAPFEAVIHTASPFLLSGDDIKKTFMDPAMLGTTGLLEAFKAYAPTVNRVVITSSLATAAVGPVDSTYVYSAKDWVEGSEEKACSNPWDGYVGFGDGYVVQGGDVGSKIARVLRGSFPRAKAIHLNFSIMPGPGNIDESVYDDLEREGLKRAEWFLKFGSAYALMHATKPATIGLALSTSPVSLLAWIGEKFFDWTDDDLSAP